VPSPYEIVVATRNRPEALSLSIPRFLRQSVLPARIVVVDASDDPSASRRAVETASRGAPVEVLFIEGPRGASHQRNLGVTQVRSGIVLFPDDDSLWAVDTAEEFVRVYDLDVEGKVGAVCGLPVVGFDAIDAAEPAAGYRVSARDAINPRIERYRRRFASRTAVEPFVVLGRSFHETWTLPPWCREHDVVPVEWMAGFRMSFRTDAIRASPFDENLTNYSLFEDTEASFAVMASGRMVLAARKARVYHHRFPGKRGNGRFLGALQILNRAYAVVRHSPPGHPARAAILPFSKAKCRSYLLGAWNRFGLDRFRGAVAATREVARLAEAPQERALATYLELRRAVTGS
jgi:glycosyltransferase involved in cell wall biosynthesis